MLDQSFSCNWLDERLVLLNGWSLQFSFFKYFMDHSISIVNLRLTFEMYLFCENRRYTQAICDIQVSNKRISKIGCTLYNDNCLGDECHVLLDYKTNSLFLTEGTFPKYFANHLSIFKRADWWTKTGLIVIAMQV